MIKELGQKRLERVDENRLFGSWKSSRIVLVNKVGCSTQDNTVKLNFRKRNVVPTGRRDYSLRDFPREYKVVGCGDGSAQEGSRGLDELLPLTPDIQKWILRFLVFSLEWTRSCWGSWCPTKSESTWRCLGGKWGFRVCLGSQEFCTSVFLPLRLTQSSCSPSPRLSSQTCEQVAFLPETHSVTEVALWSLTSQ